MVCLINKKNIYRNNSKFIVSIKSKMLSANQKFFMNSDLDSTALTHTHRERENETEKKIYLKIFFLQALDKDEEAIFFF